jgi:hypothetical protein
MTFDDRSKTHIPIEAYDVYVRKELCGDLGIKVSAELLLAPLEAIFAHTRT